MAGNGCARCHSDNAPLKATKGSTTLAVCQNEPACRRRQRQLYRQRRRMFASTKGLA